MSIYDIERKRIKELHLNKKQLLELANKTGVDLNIISNFIKGDSTVPYKYVWKLMNFIDQDVNLSTVK